MSTISAMGFNVACEKSNHRVVPFAPNMCLVPAAPSPIPAPFPIIGDTKKLTPKSHVRIGNGNSMNTDSEATIKGNQGGTLKDVVSHTTGGKAWALMGLFNVSFDGAAVVITGSPGVANTM